MMYIHGGTLSKRTSIGGSIVRVVFGSIFAFSSFIALFSSGDEPVGIILDILCFWPASFLFLFFGIRGLVNSAKTLPRHNLSKMVPMDVNNPFFTVQCEHCGLVFDYQFSDLGYRAWYPDGFVDCPRCEHHIRHSATKNIFQSEESIPNL